MIRCHAEIVIGMRVTQRMPAAANLMAARVEFVHVHYRMVGRIGDPKIQHVTGRRIELGVGRDLPTDWFTEDVNP